jgi:hypothetical protein
MKERHMENLVLMLISSLVVPPAIVLGIERLRKGRKTAS